MKTTNPKRPGISDDTLNSAQIRHLKSEKAYESTGCKSSGLFIPYYDLNGKEVREHDKPYGRLRLDKPIKDKKYHQPARSSCHAYVPPFFKCKHSEPLILVEGEFKALSLIESGYQAIGIPGFYAVIQGAPLPEIIGYLEEYKPSRIYYLGDSDTSLNYQFTDAVCKFVEVTGMPVYLPTINIDSDGKGIDDIKELMGPSFKNWFEKILSEAEVVK